MDYSAKLNRLDQNRVLALRNRDASRYRALCDELGIDLDVIEDPELYSRGTMLSSIEASMGFFSSSRRGDMQSEGYSLIENVGTGRSINVSPRNTGPDKYRLFIRESRGLSLSDNFADITMKGKLLKTYFSRFRSTGSQPIDKLTDAQVGHIFKIVYSTANRLIRQDKK